VQADGQGEEMKKILLLCALIGAGQLYSMDPTLFLPRIEPEPTYHTQQAIANTALTLSKSVDEAINMIKQLSIVHKVQYDNLKDFTKLVHLLANKFGISTADIASKFNTPIAQTYLNLGNNLLSFVGDIRPATHVKIIELIDQGADVNFSSKGTRPLQKALASYNLDVIKILIKSGVKITNDDVRKAKSIVMFHIDKEEARETDQLIEETWKKQQKK